MALLDQTVKLTVLPHSAKRWLPREGCPVQWYFPKIYSHAPTLCSSGTFYLKMGVFAFPNPCCFSFLRTRPASLQASILLKQGDPQGISTTSKAPLPPLVCFEPVAWHLHEMSIV